MPKIVIQNLHNKEIFSENETKSVLGIIHENDIDWMHACGGKGRCTTCKMVVIQGEEHLTDPTTAELKFRGMNRLKDGERLTCQCQTTGDMVIRVADENKFMHVNYSE